MRTGIVWIALSIVIVAQAGPSYVPPQYRGGASPAIPVQAVGPGEVLLELAVSRDGAVSAIKTLRANDPFTQAMTAAARTWSFKPAQRLPPGAPLADAAGKLTPLTPAESTVLVAGEFLAPTLNAPTPGEPPRDVGSPDSPDTPWPTTTLPPLYPPLALSGGVVLVEVRIAPSGDVTDAQAMAPAPPFDQAALNAARQWKFRPTRADGPVFAYIAFGFRPPVTGR